ncbi:flagellar protein FlgN [Bacillus sp. 31A1R]|uniref:Flagellar protein FlgN n=1 Tax=Robertmurraya mangrovi TaxID=3098077 RepID=A0ABU5IXV0_9BACI|nr:flagellar protein FlgN [Bacillus sp. 31A1R]MDZ5471951.1 flagellar protein FlgN [Bacillus sp. 31A1R]
MTVKNIVQALEKLILLHKSLIQISKNKTGVIIKGSAEELQSILKEENKHIQAIKKLESDMLLNAKDFLLSNNFTGEPTITATINLANKQDKETLSILKIELESLIKDLQEQNQLNQELLEQSLYFVNLSLDLLNPNIDSFNYGRQEEEKDLDLATKGRSLFDSKV